MVIHTLVSFYYIAQHNITYDEPGYIEYAKRWLHGHPERVDLLDDSKSPVVAICWVPRIVRQVINPHYKLTDYGRKDQAEGRYMMILFSFLTALYVFLWCSELYGSKGWQLPFLLLLFDPLYLAYSTIITTDLACGGFLAALLFHFRKYLLTGQTRQLWITAIFTGVAIVTKQTMLFVPVLLAVLSVAFSSCLPKQNPLLNRWSIVRGAAFAFIVLLVINLAFYFHQTFIPFGNYVFQSQTLIRLQSSLSFLHGLPVPLPEGYVQSLDMLKAHAEYGAGRPNSTYNGVYLFGHLKLNGGFWYYYLVTMFYKMPIGILLLMAGSCFLFFQKFNNGKFYTTYIFLLFPILFFGMILSFFNDFQIGIRHLLLIFPLLYIGLGKLFYDVAKMKLSYKIFVGLAVVYSIGSVMLYYPFIIPYTNEFAGDKKMVYTKLMDSNIDYGQSDSSVNGFIAAHPGYRKASSIPQQGRYALPMAQVVGTMQWNNNPYSWYQKIKPVGLYRNVILLYDIKDTDLQSAGLSGAQHQ